MKAAAFDYVRPGSLEEVLALLARYGGDGRLIAGGQSLVPMMAMRLVRPSVLIDIGRVGELTGIIEPASSTVIRAATCQVIAERARSVRNRVPLLASAMPFVGHIQTRNRGTVGGSIAHADPTAEILMVASALGADVTLRSSHGIRQVPVADLVEGPMQTGLAEDECLTEIHFPLPPSSLRLGVAVEEISPRPGDFAIVGVAAEVGLDRAGRCRHARLAACGASPVPVRVSGMEEALLGTDLADSVVAETSQLLIPQLEPDSDIHASGEYRRRVAPRLLARAVCRARDSLGEAV